MLDRLKEPSSWTAIGAGLLFLAVLVPMPALPHTVCILGGCAGLAFGLGLPERIRGR